MAARRLAPVDYGADFFDTLNDAGAASARVVLPLVLDLTGATSAIDVGCGTGIWTNEMRRLGVDAIGIDGGYVPADKRHVESRHFIEHDLEQPVTGLERRDMALCLEVAEHLTPARADGLVADLCQLAPQVVFSAATPKQGGTHHINEQWPDYWIRKFADHGYTCWDALRPALRYHRDVAWIYRQNILLFVAPEVAPPAHAEQLRAPDPGDVSFEYVARYIVDRQDGLKVSLRRAVLRRLPAVGRRTT